MTPRGETRHVAYDRHLSAESAGRAIQTKVSRRWSHLVQKLPESECGNGIEWDDFEGTQCLVAKSFKDQALIRGLS